MVIRWRLHAGVKAYWLNWLCFQQHWRIGLCSWLTTGYAGSKLWLHRTWPNMTTSWSRSPLPPLRYCGDNVITLHKPCRCCRWRCRSVLICLRLNEGHNHHFGGAVPLISYREVVGCILPSRLSQFVELHLPRLKPLYQLLDRFGDCTYHPAGFVIFAPLALLSLLIILFFPIILIVRTGKITQAVSDSSQHLLKCLFGLSGRHSRNYSTCHILLPLLNRRLCFFNSLSCPSGFPLNIILHPFLFLFIA